MVPHPGSFWKALSQCITDSGTHEVLIVQRKDLTRQPVDYTGACCRIPSHQVSEHELVCHVLCFGRTQKLGSWSWIGIWALILCLPLMSHHFEQGHCTSVISLAREGKDYLPTQNWVEVGSMCGWSILESYHFQAHAKGQKHGSL